MIVPRFTRSPIDTSIYNFYTIKRKPASNLIEKIRIIVGRETGIDPYCDTAFQGGEYVKSRQLFFYFIRRYTNMSQFATGRLLGKDRVTVLYAEKCVNKFKDSEKNYIYIFNAIDTKIKKLQSLLLNCKNEVDILNKK